MRRNSGWLASASGGREPASLWSLSASSGGEESGSLGRCSAQRYLDLLRRQQFVERRPHAPHFHLPVFLDFLACGGLFLLKVRQALHYVWWNGSEHLHALLRVERHDGSAPFLRGAVEDSSELFAGQQFVQTDRLYKSRRKLRKVLREDFGGLHAEGVERFQSGFERGVFRDSLGMQLEFDPLLDTQPANLFEVAGTCAEGQAVEHM